MPSFRTIFLVAATAFAALTSAAPHGTRSDVVGDIVSDVGADLRLRSTIDDVTLVNAGPPRLAGRTDGQRSLCDTIVLASAKISIIRDQMDKVKSQEKIDDNAVVGLIAQVKVVLDITLKDAISQKGRSTEEILSLNGKVVTKHQQMCENA
ncbi:hypothetical protein H0H81_006887, partial [Sphagnurus paluster]